MTAVDDRPITHDLVKFFDDLDVPEGVKAELLRGDIVMMAGPDLVHNEIVEDVQDQIPRRQWMRLQTQDIDLLHETSEPQPDLVVLERGVAPSSGRLLPVEAVTMLVEVVSKTSVDRDYGVKRSVYAAGRVPAYLIIDPLMAKCVLLTEPIGKGEAADYRSQRISEFGEPVPLPLLGLELDTKEFSVLKGVRRHNWP